MALFGGLAVEDVEMVFHRLGQLKWAHSRSAEQPPQFASSMDDFPRARAVVHGSFALPSCAQDVTTTISKMWSSSGLIRGKKSWGRA